jgi:hypothetical protein
MLVLTTWVAALGFRRAERGSCSQAPLLEATDRRTWSALLAATAVEADSSSAGLERFRVS